MKRNPWSRWTALTPEPPLLVGEVVAIYDVEVVVQLPGGTLLTVSGEATEVGELVFVRDGKIEGLALELATVEIEI